MINETNISGDLVQGDKYGGDNVAGNKYDVAGNLIVQPQKERTFPLYSLPLANPNFTGRDGLLKRIHDSFQKEQASIAITQAIAGLGGIGKTQLALAYAYAYQGRYDLIWWLNAESDLALAEEMMTLGRSTRTPPSVSTIWATCYKR
jgi:hypothetical protein